MMALLDFCSLPWWLPWLLPFLLGLALGWLLWGKYKQIVADQEILIGDLENKVNGLEADLQACRKVRMEAEGNVALLRGRIREMEANIQTGNEQAKTGAVSLQAGIQPIAPAQSQTFSTSDKYQSAIGNSNLQIIEGIGPKMEEVLKENGVTDFAALASKSPAELRSILDKYGDKYKIIDPKTWAQQATLANANNWNDLILLQKAIGSGKTENLSGETDSKLEKYLIKAKVLTKWAQDDLKAIEGIGPKIETLLHDAEIKSWKTLSETSVDRLRDILSAAGPRYQLADPSTWSKQAELAANANWDELNALQDFLKGGREK